MDVLKFGQGPTVVIKHLTNEYGYFKKSENPNVININANWIRGLEKSNLESSQQATAFLLAVTLLHELVHQSRAANGFPSDAYKYGDSFEDTAYGLMLKCRIGVF